MRQITLILLSLLFSLNAVSQSESIADFRKEHKETNGLFFYSSTLRMFNLEDNDEMRDLVKNIKKIKVLNYEKEKQPLDKQDIKHLRQALKAENYKKVMEMNSSERKMTIFVLQDGKTIEGVSAIIDQADKLILVDLEGSVDLKKVGVLLKKLESYK